MKIPTFKVRMTCVATSVPLCGIIRATVSPSLIALLTTINTIPAQDLYISGTVAADSDVCDVLCVQNFRLALCSALIGNNILREHVIRYASDSLYKVLSTPAQHVNHCFALFVGKDESALIE
jgi:hypothetical protein